MRSEEVWRKPGIMDECVYWKDNALLQSMVVKRIERVYRLRMLFVLHLALYGLALIALTAASAAQPVHWTVS